jgi:hypothetical protein
MSAHHLGIVHTVGRIAEADVREDGGDALPVGAADAVAALLGDLARISEVEAERRDATADRPARARPGRGGSTVSAAGAPGDRSAAQSGDGATTVRAEATLALDPQLPDRRLRRELAR